MSTLFPFLYQTRTILRASPRATRVFARSIYGTRQLRGKDDIPFVSDFNVDEDIRGEIEANENNNDDDIPSEPTRRGTITPSERQIFEGIFADIRARGLKPTLHEDGPRPTPNTAHTTLRIMQQAAQDAGLTRPAHVDPPSDLFAGTARNRQKALLRFPPDLRAAASRALDTIGSSGGFSGYDDIEFDEATIAASQEQVDESWNRPADALGRSVDLEAKRRPERMRIEALMAAAKTDFELWDVLEKEVFIMPSKLGLNTGASELDEIESTELAKTKKDKEKVEPLEKVPGIDAVQDEISASPEKLSIYVHGPLYPAYLLLALRRLEKAFRSPSPLAFSVLPRIKELGLESYVLGVTTPFYNELLQIYWTRRGDLSGMLGLLDEMRQCGLYFDEQTKSILNHVDLKLRDLAYRPTSGSFTRAVMDMPEYGEEVRGRVQEWHEAVDLSIRERERDRRRERVVGY